MGSNNVLDHYNFAYVYFSASFDGFFKKSKCLIFLSVFSDASHLLAHAPINPILTLFEGLRMSLWVQITF